jgi:peptidoglycan/xylan/chitin deacetylase (PgdA/CDA1 family)
MYVEERVFAQSMAYLRTYCHPLSLSDFVDHAVSGIEYPRNAVVVTFDDGYANNLLRAAPILTEYKIPATFFITTGYVDGHIILWPTILDRYFVYAKSMPDLLENLGLPMRWTSDSAREIRSQYSARLKAMEPVKREAVMCHLRLAPTEEPDTTDAVGALTWDQLRKLSSVPGMAVGPHTVSHPILTQLPENQARQEIAVSYQRIQEEGIPVAPFFAYPFGGRGDFTLREIHLVQKLGFRCALATHPGLVPKHPDVFNLPRYGGKNDFTRFVCHASGLQSILSGMTGYFANNQPSADAYGGH